MEAMQPGSRSAGVLLDLRPGHAAVVADGDLAQGLAAPFAAVEHHRAVGKFDHLHFVDEADFTALAVGHTAARRGFAQSPVSGRGRRYRRSARSNGRTGLR